MLSMPINVFLWKINKEDRKLVDKIVSAISQHANISLEAKVDDLSIVEALKELDTPCIAFGDMASRQYCTTGCSWILPDISKLRPGTENTTIRQETFERIKEIGQQLATIAIKDEDPVCACVEMPDGTTVGKTCTDIQITEQEIQYLNQLKDLLGGSKVVITKGDIQIEVF